MHNGMQGVGSGQGKVTVVSRQCDVAKVLERREAELRVKKPDRSQSRYMIIADRVRRLGLPGEE